MVATSNPVILVIGAAGRFSGLVVPELVRRGAVVRGLVRSDEQAGVARRNGATEVARGDLRRPDSLDVATRGVDAVFHIGPAFVTDEADLGLNVVQAARRNGVAKFVFSGVAHPSDRLANHAAKRPVEDALFRSGMVYTILQPMTLYQNIGLAWPQVLATSEFGEPFSPGIGVARVDYRDVAEVAAVALTGSRLDFGTFELCSGEAPDRNEIVAVMSDVLGRRVRATSPSFDTWAATAATRYDPQQLALFAAVFRSYDDHGLAGNSIVLHAILGREPRTLRTYLTDLAAGQRTDAA